MSSPTPLLGHVSIDTHDLARSLTFYRALFGGDPVLERPDYVRFQPAEPALVLGLNRRDPVASPGHTGPLQHLGVLFREARDLRAARARLGAAGFASSGAEHVECCYAELDQYWVTDPSGVRWELFLAHEDVRASTSARGPDSACCGPTCAQPGVAR